MHHVSYSGLRILVSSYAFSPSVGGIEVASETLAGEFARREHEVKLVTQTPEPDRRERSFQVIRQPGVRELWRLYRWADVVFQNNLSLRFLWPNFLAAKPCVVTTQTWLSGTANLETRFSRLKRAILRRCRNVAVSHAVAEHVGHPSVVLGNPYDARTFQRLPGVERTRELLFVGRLVSDKGLDLLLMALGRLRDCGLHPNLTIAGDGPERSQGEKLARELGLGERVKFSGVVQGTELARLMNAHQILVVPSRWAEPFGIVAIESIACGCVVVGSEAGGLKEAIGPCGMSFKNGSVDDLTEVLRLALTQPDLTATWTREAEAHLSRFQAPEIAAKYLALFAQAKT